MTDLPAIDVLLAHARRGLDRVRPEKLAEELASGAIGERVGFKVVERQRLWAGYFERVRLQKP